MESLNLQIVAVLMILEVKYHSIAYLKALTCSIEHASRQGHGRTFIYQRGHSITKHGQNFDHFLPPPPHADNSIA